MKLFIAICIFAILVSSDDQINANKLGQDLINSLERALNTNDVDKVNKFYADDFVLEKCGETFNKTTLVETLSEPEDAGKKSLKVTNGKYDGVELKFTLITEINNQPVLIMDYIVQKSDDGEPKITYNNFTNC